ncbi:MAG: DUF5820 family protein [Halobacteria archaeon]
MNRDLDDSYAGRELPEGWRVWSEEDGVVLCYKPWVFDGEDFPRPCLPIITVTKADVGTMGDRDGWRVSFHLEADVQAYGLQETIVGYDSTLDYMTDLAERFNGGELDFAGMYAEDDERWGYLEKLNREIKKD